MQHKRVPMAKIIRDQRNGDLDYLIPLWRAKELYEQRKLVWDVTNGQYATKDGSKIV